NTAPSRQRKQAKVLTDADHYLKLRESCVASLRSDRHEIGMTDRHHRNPHRVLQTGCHEAIRSAHSTSRRAGETCQPLRVRARPRVFGSVLSGMDTDESDLDLLVEPGRSTSLLTG